MGYNNKRPHQDPLLSDKNENLRYSGHRLTRFDDVFQIFNLPVLVSVHKRADLQVGSEWLLTLRERERELTSVTLSVNRPKTVKAS